MVNDDCGDCKENEYLLFVYPDKSNLPKLKQVLIEHFDYTNVQVDLLFKNPNNIDKHPVFIGDKTITFKKIDYIVNANINAEIKRKRKVIFK